MTVTDVLLALASMLAGTPFVLNRDGAATVVPGRHRPPAQAWMAGPDAYESFVTGGVRALFDRTPMRYDVAIYSGGGS